MSGWGEHIFGDLIDFPPKVNLPKNIEIAYIDMDRIDPEQRYVTNLVMRKVKGSASKFENNDILFARITPCLENRKIAQVKIANKGFGSTEFFVFRAKKSKLDQCFLYYLSKGNYIVQHAINSYVGASGRQRADEKYLKRIKVKIPKLPIQQKISAVLTIFDDLLENNNSRIEILEKISEEIFKEWFIRKRFPGYKNTKTVKGIPIDWSLCELKDITKFISRPTKAGEILIGRNYLPLDKIASKKIVPDSYLPYTEAMSSLILFNKGDIIFGAMRPYLHKVCIAPFDGVTRNTCFILGPKKELYYSYLFFLLFQNTTIEYASLISQGSDRPYVVWSNGFEKMKILLPSNRIISEFNSLIKPFLIEILNLSEQNQILKKTRDVLSTRLLNNKISLENVDIKFPPSMENENA